MKVEVKFKEGDLIKFNDEEWKVFKKTPKTGKIALRSVEGNIQKFSKEEIEKQIELTGKFSRFKESYIGIP